MELSDDSDFYGDDETVLGLHHRVDDFDAEAWLLKYRETPARPLPHSSVVVDMSHLHNPYAGISYAWQLTETVDAFLERLPPRTTDQTVSTPWIYICNPFISRVKKALAENQASKGNEDEAPEEEGGRTSLVIEGGMERLALVTSFTEGMRKAPRTESTQDREISKERKRAVEDILNLAHAAKVRAGKWMLFCPPAEVNDVWEIIAKATANNELGIAAKVLPRTPLEDSRKDRLICVYTSDFKDKADVGRVLQKLRELKLVESRGRPIYYKPDVFTYLGIASGNSWGLKASIYNSIGIF
ncbi:hypothetical protein EDB81DRAFT_416243 [Dactylonectria macrodidyma]|uniref:DUF1917-domain-containing protein n=1 Tax=Dactylonectria macrodidyma TaxID=307937 RepID=A0A9P9JAS4_9HYPO|nr:hypothetical protein EDB81DRAFT_416243 [Dactylonectria macrodidyma]